MSLWSERVLPLLVEKACRSSAIKEERARWVPRARGRTLEVGVGSGLNLAFYDPARVERVTAIDPSEPLLARARERVRSAPVPVELLLGQAEELPFPDATFDAVLVTYSLCSVRDPARALAEIRRVLRPDAELLFVEHGLAPEPRRWQERLTPYWRRISGNCHLDRDVSPVVHFSDELDRAPPVAPEEAARALAARARSRFFATVHRAAAQRRDGDVQVGERLQQVRMSPSWPRSRSSCSQAARSSLPRPTAPSRTKPGTPPKLASPSASSISRSSSAAR